LSFCFFKLFYGDLREDVIVYGKFGKRSWDGIVKTKLSFLAFCALISSEDLFRSKKQKTPHSGKPIAKVGCSDFRHSVFRGPLGQSLLNDASHQGRLPDAVTVAYVPVRRPTAVWRQGRKMRKSRPLPEAGRRTGFPPHSLPWGGSRSFRFSGCFQPVS